MIILHGRPRSVLTASVAASATGVINITTEGSIGWSKWGKASSSEWNHKSGANQISDVTVTGTPLQWNATNAWPELAWTDGTPTESGSTYALVYVEVVGSKHVFTVPASQQLRTLKIYTGAYECTSTLTASLSDGSAPPAVLSLDSSGATASKYTATIQFRAKRAGQALTISHEIKTSNSGWIPLLGATLA